MPISKGVARARAVSLLVACVLFAATGMPPELVSSIERRVRDAQATRSEKRFDEIGWAKNILDAERLAKQYGRPVFLFTHDGKMETGRC